MSSQSSHEAHGPLQPTVKESEHIRSLAHHIVSTTLPENLPGVTHLLKKHPVSRAVLFDHYQHTLGLPAPEEE